MALPRWSLLALLLPLGSAAPLACGSGGDAPPPPDDPIVTSDAGVDVTQPVTLDSAVVVEAAPEDTTPGYTCAPHAAIPEIKYWGGPLLTAPEIVTITHKSMDPTMRTQIEQFSDTVTESAWWDTVMKGYCDAKGQCIGHGKSGGHVVLQDDFAGGTTFSDSQIPGEARTIVDFIQKRITSGELPPPHDQTLYAIYFPSSITVTLDGTASCQGFGGYHFAADFTPKDGSPVVRAAYAIMPTCYDALPLPDLTGMLIGVASHEYIEAATDAKSLGPDIRNADWGYYMEDPAWGILWGGQEVGDMCGRYSSSMVGDHRVTRGWLRTSPACSAPCGPGADGDVYYGAAPAKQIIELAVGESADVEITAFAEKPIGDWKMSVVEPSQGAFGPGYGKHLEFSLEGGASVDGGPSSLMVNNGRKVTMHVKLVSSPPVDANFPSKTDQRFRHAFAYVASRLDKDSVNVWPFTVRQKNQ